MNVIAKDAHVGAEPIPVEFFIRGEIVSGDEVRHRSRDLGVDFATPAIDLNRLVTPRSELPPLLDVPLAEIVDFLVETGNRLDVATNDHLRAALDHTCKVNALPRRIIENLFTSARQFMSRDLLELQVSANFANPDVLDRWVERIDKNGSRASMRAFPPRMVHMLAGNAPSGCVSSIAQGALVKAINVFKMPSSDPFTCVAVLRTMAEIDASHPVVRSMSAVYWRGGDERIERTLYRPQYFDRIVAWGGGDAINNVIRYLGPGIQLVSFDPKTSISVIGPQGFASKEVIDEVAELAAVDVSMFNQDACVASRFIFVEGERDGIEAFCARLAERLPVDRPGASVFAPPTPEDIRPEIELLELMGECRTWGSYDGRGLVILTEEPVGFHPTNKTVNVVHLPSLDEVPRFVNVATQTIGMYPPELQLAMRDRLASAGAQRVVRLGGAALHVMGGPHDAMFALQRFVHWMSDEAAVAGSLV